MPLSTPDLLRALGTLPSGLTGRGVRVIVIDGKNLGPYDHAARVIRVLKTVAPDAEVIHRNTIDGGPDYEPAETSLEWCIANGVRLVNMSIGRPVDNLREAYDAGVVMLASAGNSVGGPIWQPAASPYVIAVGGYDLERRQIEPVNSQGPAMARRGILMPGRWYGEHETSFYAPVATGVLALYAEHLGRYPTPDEAWEFLRANARDVGAPGPDTVAGWGVFAWPTTLPAKTEEVKPLRTIMIDPGHGGPDSGAAGPTGLREKDVNLSIARFLVQALPAGVSGILTRDSDVEVGLYARSAHANIAEVDAFISIHCNAADSRAASGVETYSLSATGDGARLAKLIQGKVVAATGALNRGAKTANFAVLRETAMPAALVEVGFLSSPLEEEQLKGSGYHLLIARAIADAVAEYFGLAVAEPAPLSMLGRQVDDEAAVYVRGQPLKHRAIIIDGVSYAPVREIGEAAGYTVRWQPGRVDLD